MNALAALAFVTLLRPDAVVHGRVTTTLRDYDGRTGEPFTVALVETRDHRTVPVLCLGAELAMECDSTENMRAAFAVRFAPVSGGAVLLECVGVGAVSGK